MEEKHSVNEMGYRNSCGEKWRGVVKETLELMKEEMEWVNEMKIKGSLQSINQEVNVIHWIRHKMSYNCWNAPKRQCLIYEIDGSMF